MYRHRFDPIAFVFGVAFVAIALLVGLPDEPWSFIVNDLALGWLWPVLLVAVGERQEAGIQVQVRRVLSLGAGNGTRVEVTERVPGDFCSPAGRETHPYQIVVIPSGGLNMPIEFTAPVLERIPCGA